MCLLMVKPAGVPLPADFADIADQAAWANPDGVGFAYTRDGKVIRHRSVSVTPAEFARIAQTQIPDAAPAIIHFRFGTSGGTRKALCHPFRIGDGSAFAHNGVLPIKPAAGMSDTATIAASVARADALLAACAPHVSPGNKFAVLQPSSELTILGEEHGQWDADIWYSNTYWQTVGTQAFCWEPDHFGDHEELGLTDELTSLVSRYGYTAVREALRDIKSSFRVGFGPW